MCKIIAIANQKGGVGKTTTTSNLGIGLAKQGKRVLLIDADAQGSLTASLGFTEPDKLEVTLASVMEKVINDEEMEPGYGILKHEEGIDLMPGNIELSGLEVSLVNVMSREIMMRSYMDMVKEQYDYILIDCMPSLGMITINAFACADSILIPVQAAYLPVKGLEQLIKTIGNDAEPVCTCEDKCGAYEYDRNCKVCVEDYKLCAYKRPNVSISINKPDGWFNDMVAVTFRVADVAHTGNFEVAKIQAKVGQNGSWADVTEDKKLDISENCTVYVQVTDQKGNTYEKNRAIKCFDTAKPTLNAAVSDGLLSVQVHDNDSGAKAVYVNGYEFTELTNGTLNIRLQQFDAGYEYFTIAAMDNAGNMSEIYKTKNPYYKDPADESDDNPAEQLPVNAEATKPGSATGTVTEHTKTDSDGNTISGNSLSEQKKKAMAEADASEKEENGNKEESGNNEKKQSEQGKEFYTIQTASDKVFYLIIDRDGEEELVYFLTEITENDLLNVTSGNSETLPKNSAALESAIPTEEGALPNNNGELPEDTEQAEENPEGEEDTENPEETESTEEPEPEEKAKEPNPVISYILMGALVITVIGGAYYFKVVRKKKEDFIEDEDEDEEDEEELENEDEELEDGSGDDFFDDKEDE